MKSDRQLLEELYWKRGLSSRKIAKLVQVSHVTVLKRMKKYNIQRRALTKEITNPHYKRMTKEKAYVLGVMCGDGCLWKGFSKKRQVTKITQNPEYHIRLVAIDKDFVDHFSKCIQFVYGFLPSYKFRKSKNKKWSDTHTVYCRRKLIFNDISSFGDFSTEKWRIPREILYSNNKEFVCNFLKGFFDSEGTVSSTKYNCYIRADSNNESGLKEIVFLLNKINIKTTGISKDRNCYYFSISNKDGLVKFRESIGFSIGRKLKKLDLAISQYVRNNGGNMTTQNEAKGIHIGLI